MTHANDMQQRHVELAVTQNYSGTGVNVVSPPNADVAPPGYGRRRNVTGAAR